MTAPPDSPPTTTTATTTAPGVESSFTAGPPKTPQFPASNAPRVWFLTDGLSPIALALSKLLLDHGDYIIAGVISEEFSGERGDGLRSFLADAGRQPDIDISNAASPNSEDGGERKGSDKKWKERYRALALDGRIVGQCQSATAEALEIFGRIDVLLICKSEALVGTIEELAQSTRTISLIRDQFETNFFSAVNIIKAVLPSMREKKNGHIVVMTGISAHLGTPGLGLYCSSQWALEGYCDSLAYEIAPFNIKMTILQPNLEINVLSNKITSVPSLPQYLPDVNPAPLSRDILSNLLDKLSSSSESTAQQSLSPEHAASDTQSTSQSSRPAKNTTNVLAAEKITSLYPSISPIVQSQLTSETVFAIAAIGGHDNPPARHIVGYEGVASVKEKLKTVSEELEEFVEVSGQVDIARVDEAGSVIKMEE